MHISGNVFKTLSALVLKRTSRFGTYDHCQRPSAFRINKEERRDSENNLDRAVAQRGVQCLSWCVSDICEDGRTIKRNDCYELALVIR